MATAKKSGSGAGVVRSVLGIKIPKEPKNVRVLVSSSYKRAYSDENMRRAANRVRVYNRYVGDTERIARKGGFMVSVNLIRRKRPTPVSRETFMFDSAGGERSRLSRIALSRTLGGRSWQSRAKELLRRFVKALGPINHFKRKITALFERYGITARQFLQIYDLGLIPDELWHLSLNHTSEKDFEQILQEFERNVIDYKNARK